MIRLLGTTRSGLLAAVLCVGLVSCREDESERPIAPTDGIRLELDKSNDRQLLSFYIGGMVSPVGGNPFENNLLKEADGEFQLLVPEIVGRWPELDEPLNEISVDGVIDWDEFEGLISAYYYVYRDIPPTLGALREEVGDWNNDSTWFGFSVDGVMSPDTRHIRVSIDHLKEAIAGYRDNDEQIIYPSGTTFISETREGGRPAEVSVMTKRQDGFWDFYAYGPDSTTLSVLERSPTDLLVPTRCVGCHFGSRLFEPERSFPIDPSPGPDGPRKLHVTRNEGYASLVSELDEHRKRSDTVLGLYATLFIARLQSLREKGELDSEWESILNEVGF